MKDLTPHPKNPRILSTKNHAELLKSFKKFSYAELVAINFDNTILAGHQRIAIMKELGWGDTEIEVRVPNYLLSDKEAEEYLIRSNKNIGEWDFDILANEWELEELVDYGFEESDFKEDDWQSNIDTDIDEDAKDELDDVVKINCDKGFKKAVIDLITPVLKELNVKIK